MTGPLGALRRGRTCWCRSRRDSTTIPDLLLVDDGMVLYFNETNDDGRTYGCKADDFDRRDRLDCFRGRLHRPSLT
ncbi:MAG: hypothetical protein R3E12_18965 [Candidatus Eisenbacteria bacterium]